jgi:hypothetical protein
MGPLMNKLDDKQKKRTHTHKVIKKIKKNKCKKKTLAVTVLTQQTDRSTG